MSLLIFFLSLIYGVVQVLYWCLFITTIIMVATLERCDSLLRRLNVIGSQRFSVNGYRITVQRQLYLALLMVFSEMPMTDWSQCSI